MDQLSISCRRRVIDTFSNLNELIHATQKADAVVPPITIEVASKQVLESFVKEALSAFGRQTVVSHSFTCKLDKLGLSLPLKDSEIKGIEGDEYPLTLTFNSYDEIKVFASAYDNATPVARVTSKTIQERVKNIAESSQSKNRKLLYVIGAAVVALIIAIPIFSGGSSSKKNDVQNSKSAKSSRSLTFPISVKIYDSYGETHTDFYIRSKTDISIKDYTFFDMNPHRFNPNLYSSSISVEVGYSNGSMVIYNAIMKSPISGSKTNLRFSVDYDKRLIAIGSLDNLASEYAVEF